MLFVRQRTQQLEMHLTHRLVFLELVLALTVSKYIGVRHARNTILTNNKE